MSTSNDGEDFSLEELDEILRSPERVKGLAPDRLLQVLFLTARRYGSTNDSELVSSLSKLMHLATQSADEFQRQQLLDNLVVLVDHNETGPNALLPFIFDERSIRAVGTAALSYAILETSADGDPLTPAKCVLKWILDKQLANRGAAFGGLIALGDQRLLSFLKDYRGEFTPKEMQCAAYANSDFPQIETFEWWLEWILEAPGTYNDEIFGIVGIAIYNMVVRSLVPFMSSGFRPLAEGPSEGAMVDGSDSKKIYFPEDIGAIYSEHFYALEKNEAPPKLISDLMKHFGLEPAAPIEQQYQPENIERYRSSEHIWLKFILGPYVGFEKPAPDGLPFRSSETDEDEIAKWWHFELEGFASSEPFFSELISSVSNIPNDQIISVGRFTLKNGKWYPTIISRTSISEEAIQFLQGIELDRTALDAMLTTASAIDARNWIDFSYR